MALNVDQNLSYIETQMSCVMCTVQNHCSCASIKNWMVCSFGINSCRNNLYHNDQRIDYKNTDRYDPWPNSSSIDPTKDKQKIMFFSLAQ